MDNKYDNQVIIHTKEDFEGMRKAGRLAADILDFIEEYVKEGVSTEYLNELCHNKIIDAGAVPAPLNYRGFPKSICTSINQVVCHGIPSEDVILKEGDIMNIDVTVILDGWHGDTSRMYKIGKVSQKANSLCRVTYESMMKGIEVVKPGARVGDIGRAIQKHATMLGFAVVRDFCGHGLGRNFHSPPSIMHYDAPIPDSTIVLEEGMFFTIEPMINVGTYKTKILSDNWTAVTKDSKLSAQYEHSLGVTADGYEIFTLSAKERGE